MIKVLIYGGGAREHAIAYKIKQSPLLERLYLCKPNDGFADLGEVVFAENHAELAQMAKDLGVNMLVVGPEVPLMEGIVDEFDKQGIFCVGADKKWAELEGSKSFAKEFMARNNISTAKYAIISEKSQVNSVLDGCEFPIVLKADGLAAGKGVVIAQNYGDAEGTLYQFLDGKYGEASSKIVVEEFLEGQEISLIAFWDGKNLLPLVPARDYKRLMDSNMGPNTGGMGAYCPVSLTAEEFASVENYLDLLKQALTNEKADFAGIVYSGLMMTNQGVKVLEYNMRFGDPETQAILLHLESDLLDVFLKMQEQKLDEVNLKWKSAQTFCVVVAAEGYPEKPIAGGVLRNIDTLQQTHDVEVFYAGVKAVSGELQASGGRVLSVCKNGITAQKDIYDFIEDLDYSDKIYRKDVGEVSIFKKGCENERTCNNCGV